MVGSGSGRHRGYRSRPRVGRRGQLLGPLLGRRWHPAGRIDDVTGEVLDGPELTWSGTGLQYPEAPHLYERDGVWYLLIAEGGTERGHAVSIAAGRLADRAVGAVPREPDPESPLDRPTDPEHRPRRPCRGPGRAVVDGAARGPSSGDDARLPRARARDVPRAGGVGRRLAGGRRRRARARGSGRRGARGGMEWARRLRCRGVAPALDQRAPPAGRHVVTCRRPARAARHRRHPRLAGAGPRRAPSTTPPLPGSRAAGSGELE